MVKKRKKATKTKARRPAKRKAAASGAKRRARKTTAKRRAPKTRSAKPAARKRRVPSPPRKKKRTARAAAAAGASVERPRARMVRGGGRGLGAEAAGQSGDLEGIPRREDVDSESVEELLEEGQSWEAGIVSGVEEADDDEGEVRTREVPEDDVPEEYRDEKD